MKLSLILPVYNVEKYVEQCILSCLNQDIPKSDYEIIIVNDGTKDNSLEIVMNIAKQYNNITVVSQENAGLSAARNKGLSLAKGDYVWFIDTDDYIQENCLRGVIDRLYSADLEALSISAANFYDDGVRERKTRYNSNKDIKTGEETLLTANYGVCAQFTIYKVEFLTTHNLRFMVGIFHEDNEFTPRAYYYLNRVSSYDEIIYFVRQNPDSITRSINPKKSYDCIEVAKSLAAFTDSEVCSDMKPKFYNLISVVINSSFHNILRSPDKEILRLFNEYLYENRGVFKCLKRSPVLKNRVESFLFLLFPHHVLSIYKFLLLFKL